MTNLPNGWYEVLVGLYEKIPDNGPEVVWEGIFVLRIVAGETTSGEVVIPESQIRFGTGAISLTIGEDLDNPLAVAFTGPPGDATVMDRDLVTFTSTGTYSGSEGYRWYVDGSFVSSGNPFTHQFTAAGEYMVSLLVLDQGVLGASDYSHTFGYYRTTVNGAATPVGTATGLGTGKANTEALVGAMGETAYIAPDASKTTTTGDYAARLCELHVSGGYDDWFLPSKDELNLMYLNLKTKGIGGLFYFYYWSSSEGSGSLAWTQYFSGGTQYNINRRDEHRIRPVRAF